MLSIYRIGTKYPKQTKTEHKILDKYRDNNWLPVYKCKVCGFRGIGASVTLHDHSHGPMIREEINYD